MTTFDTWGSSWGTSWSLSWTREVPIDPTLAARESRLYTNFITLYEASGIDLVNDTIKIQPMTSDYTLDVSHQYFTDLADNYVGTALAIGGTKYVNSDGEFKTSEKKKLFSRFTGAVNAFVLFKDTGDPATSPLISYHKLDFNDIVKTMSGGDIEWIYNTRAFFKVDPEWVYDGRVASFRYLKPAWNTKSGGPL